eukprot:9476961-Pyramimonas_sp.AAC.1
MFGAVKDVRGGGVDGHSASVCGRIGGLSTVNGHGLETMIVICHHLQLGAPRHLLDLGRRLERVPLQGSPLSVHRGASGL